MPTFRRPARRASGTAVQSRRKGAAGAAGAKGKTQARAPGARSPAEEAPSDRSPIEQVRADLARLQAPRRTLDAGEVEPMLAETAPAPFSRKGFLFELKVDGFRAIAGKRGATTSLHYRRGRDATATYPDLALALRALPVESLVLDGEIAVLDAKGLPSFQRLQKRALLSQPLDLAHAVRALPAVYFAFDLLGFEEWDLRPLPLRERKRLLRLVVPKGSAAISVVDDVEEHGAELFERVVEAGLEGVMGKRADAPYAAGRSADWLKVRIQRSGDFVIVGFTRPDGERSGFGALHLALRSGEGDALLYVGRVGSGFSEEQLGHIGALLEPLRVPEPPCAGPVPRGAAHVWVQPRQVCEVRYHQITDEGLLRQAVFVRLRDDKDGAAGADRAPPAREPPLVAPVRADDESPQRARITNARKILWPVPKISKGELIDYYGAIAPWLLPWLRDRPLTVTRYPNGIEGKNFFQKNVPAHAPPWLRTERTGDVDRRFSEHAEGADIRAPVVDDARSLLFFANLAAIPLHIPADRLSMPGRPDYSVIDLDPKTAPFADVVRLALAVRELCDEIGMPSFPKTSGQKGMHVLLPLGGACTHDESQALAEVLVRVIEREHPDISSTERIIERRRGRVYLDAWQNGRGRTIVAAFSARPVPEGTVSMPLRWDEVTAGLDPKQFTLRNAPARMRALKTDPCAPALTLKPDVPAILARLARRVRP